MEEIQFFLIKKINSIGIDKSYSAIKKNKKILRNLEINS